MVKMFQEIGTGSLLVDDFQRNTETFYIDQYNKGRCIHAVYEHESKVIACAGGMIRTDDFIEASFKQAEYGYIMDVYVLEPHRRKGIAQGLVSEILKWLQQKEISSITLDASKLSGDLYAKIGFDTSTQMSLKTGNP